MKNKGAGWKFLIFWGFMEKSNFEVVYKKPTYGGGGDCLKRGAGTVCKFKGGLAKNEGVGLMGVWYPNTHYVNATWIS